MNESIPIQSTDFWAKVMEMLQQNWAVIEPEATETELRFPDRNSELGEPVAVAGPQVRTERQGFGAEPGRRKWLPPENATRNAASFSSRMP